MAVHAILKVEILQNYNTLFEMEFKDNVER